MKIAIDTQTPNLAAGNIATPLDHLYQLALHEDEQIRMKVAENPMLPAAGFGVLVNDESPEVRISVSDNPFTPMSLLELLAADEHPDVRYAMAENANTPPHLLNMLTRDDNPYIADRACKTLNRLDQQIFASLRQCA